MKHQRMNATQLLQRMGERLTEPSVVNAQHLPLHEGRVRQRTQHIKECAHAQFTTRTNRMLHRTVVRRRKHKAEPNLLNTLRNLRRGQGKINAQRLQNIG